MKILFISHEASRTGAPLILLHLIKWLNSNSQNMKFDILLINGGAIADDFKEECANVFVYSERHKPLKFAEVVKEKMLFKLGLKRKKDKVLFLKKIASNNYDLIYANSVVSIPIAVDIKTNCKNSNLLAHIHELNTIIKMVVPDFDRYKKYIDKYIAVSHQVRNNLIDNYSIDKKFIDVIYEFGVVTQTDICQVKKDTFTIGASGNAHWRKGDDVFIQVANYVITSYPEANVEFVWVGDNLNNKIIIEEDINKLGIKDKVKFVGEQINPIEFYRNFDVFLLTSREDPFPLVCIEAANLGKPIICFEKASGTAEVIENGGGFVVPYLDIVTMAKRIMVYYNSRNKMNEDGEKAKQLFAQFTVEKIAPLIFDKIISQLNNRNY
jgi:glycosyltransferase involved in cell wall biosynthesis